jgi:hypothetical protein
MQKPDLDPKNKTFRIHNTGENRVRGKEGDVPYYKFSVGEKFSPTAKGIINCYFTEKAEKIW